MLKLLLLLISTASLSAKIFQTPRDEIINDFSVINEKVYVTTPTRTYLLNDSFSVAEEYSKSFNKSMLFYANSDFLFECGENLTASDSCCYLRDPLTLSSIDSINSELLCYQFQPMRFHYPCYTPKSKGNGYNFYIMVSFYNSPGKAGSFGPVLFKQISNNKTNYDASRQYSFDSSVMFRPQVLSPKPSELRTYVVLKKSGFIKQAYYFLPDVERVEGNAAGSLFCDESKSDVISGFGLMAENASKVGNILSPGKLTHFVLFKNETGHRICSYTEDTEMKPLSSSDRFKLEPLYKEALFTNDDGTNNITAFNGYLVNDELVILYSIGKDVHKVRLFLRTQILEIRSLNCNAPITIVKGIFHIHAIAKLFFQDTPPNCKVTSKCLLP